MTVTPIHAQVDGDTVTMPRAEFERLIAALQDAEDAATFDAAQRRLAAGEDEFLPAAVVDRLVGGENPVQVWRDHRGLMVDMLAERAGISTHDLTQIEAGDQASVGVFKALATALGVGIEDLV